jgi:hypothetical protein
MALQIRRGLNGDRASSTIAVGEIVWTTDRKQLYVGDGTPGGVNILESYVGPGTGLSYDGTTGKFSVDAGNFDLTTDDVAEGANKYYVANTAKDDIGAMLQNGTNTGITITYNDVSHTITCTVSSEAVEDGIATMFTGGSHQGIGFTYTDNSFGSGTINATVSTEFIEDTVNPMLTHAGHTGITFTYNDNGTNAGILTAVVDSLSTEQVEDIVAPMFTGGTHTGITFTYGDNGTGSGFVNAAVDAVSGDIEVDSVDVGNDITVAGNINVNSDQVIIEGTTGNITTVGDLSVGGNTELTGTLEVTGKISAVGGGSVESVTVGDLGVYTTRATVTFSDPTVAGVTALGTTVMEGATAVVTDAGTGYTVGDLLAVDGIAGSLLYVASITGPGPTGPVATVNFTGPDAVRGEVDGPLPTGARSTTAFPSGGISCTVTVTYRVKSVTITEPGTGYSDGTDASITFSNGVSGAGDRATGTVILAPSLDVTGNIFASGDVTADNLYITGAIVGTPKLGSDLNLDTHGITGFGNIEVSGPVGTPALKMVGQRLISSLAVTNTATLRSDNMVAVGSFADPNTLWINSEKNFGVFTGITDGTTSTGLLFRNGRNALTLLQTLQPGDPMISIEAQGHDGTAFVPAGSIIFAADPDEVVTTGNVPSIAGFVTIDTTGGPNFMTFNSKGVLTAPVIKATPYATGSLPTTAGAASEGFIVFDTTTKQFKGWNGSTWVILG